MTNCHLGREARWKGSFPRPRGDACLSSNHLLGWSAAHRQRKDTVEKRWKEKGKTSNLEQALRLSWDKSVFLFHQIKEELVPGVDY